MLLLYSSILLSHVAPKILDGVSFLWLLVFLLLVHLCRHLGFPGSSAGKESACNVGDLGWIPGLDPWVGKIHWRRKRLPTPVFWRRECHGL